MKGLTTNIIATRRYGSTLTIKDEFFKRFAIHQVIGSADAATNWIFPG